MTLTDNHYKLLEILEEEGKPVTLNNIMILKRKKKLKYTSEDLLNRLRNLIKEKVVTITIEKKKEVFSITDLGREKLIQRPSTKDTSKHSKGEEDNQQLIIVDKKKSDKTKDSQPKKEDNWLEWTTPEWVEKNNQWEFYKKQEGQIIEVYHSQDEEEIRKLQSSKVMQHIMAAMETPKTEEEKKRSRHPIQYKLSEETKQSLDNPVTGRGSQRVGDSSIFLHLDAKRRLLEMKLQGYTLQEITITVCREYNLKHITVGLYLSEVIKEIRERSKGITEETLRTHLDRYEQIFKWFRENGYAKMALKALERKERLVGLHDSESVDKQILSTISEKNGGSMLLYDWGRLTDIEMKRLLTLVKRTVIILKPLESTEEK